MSEDDQSLHRKFAVDCFNGTWGLLDKTDRTAEDNFKMIHLAHASRYHWGEIGTPLEFARGDWQILRVYAVLGMGEASYIYAENCLNHCLENHIGDFDLAFAYEALARASAILGDKAKLEEHKNQANKAGEAIIDQSDRNYFFGELKTI
jgi:hypothetical protein